MRKSPPKINLLNNLLFYGVFIFSVWGSMYLDPGAGRIVCKIVMSLTIALSLLATLVCSAQKHNIHVRMDVAKIMQDKHWDTALLLARVGALFTVSMMIYGGMHWIITTLYVVACVGTELNYNWNLRWQKATKGGTFD